MKPRGVREVDRSRSCIAKSARCRARSGEATGKLEVMGSSGNAVRGNVNSGTEPRVMVRTGNHRSSPDHHAFPALLLLTDATTVRHCAPRANTRGEPSAPSGQEGSFVPVNAYLNAVRGTDPVGERAGQLAPADGGSRWQQHRAGRQRLSGAAAEPDHLPRLRGQGRERQRHLRADAAAERGGSAPRHLPLHQLPGWLGRLGHGDLRHDEVDLQRRGHGGHGPGRLDGPVPALRRHQGQAVSPCRTAGS